MKVLQLSNTAVAAFCIAAGMTSIAVTRSGAVPAGQGQTDAQPAVSAGDVVQSNTRFALDMYSELRSQDGNLFFSPYSVSTALAMTYAGARNETAEQMASTLHFDMPSAQLHPAFAALAESLIPSDDEDAAAVELHIANRLWGENADEFIPGFLETVRKHYAGGFGSVVFNEQGRRIINAWVEQQTRDKIRELLKKPDLQGPVILVLTNAIYFKGDWLTQFDEKHTRDGIFHVDGETTVQTPMMALTAEFPYFESDQLQALELPYDGERLSMVILLPRQRDGLPAIEEALTVGNLRGWLSGLSKQEVRVSLPRFKLQSRFYLGEMLKSMGMPLAFEHGAADFSGMWGEPGDLWISKVIHQAFVEVNEEGTEAAAATAVVMKTRAALDGPPTFRADHPFIFLIRDRETGSILFLGRCADPSE